MDGDDELAFLATYDAGDFARPYVTVDVVLIGIADESLCVALVRRTAYPELGTWSLPGGFVGVAESLDDAAARVLSTKAHVTGVYLEQLYTFGRPDRDPRTRVISVAYYALVERSVLDTIPIGENARIFSLHAPAADVPVRIDDGRGDVVEIAFDHREIIELAVRRVRGKLDYTPVGFALLPPQFTLLQLQRVHEIILGARLNKDSFRRRMLASGELTPTGDMQAGVDHRPAALYRRSTSEHMQ